jgi:hypothetical protein
MSKTLFLLGCIPFRILLAYIAFSFPNNKLLTIFASIIGISFFMIYATGMRKTGIETGGKPIWWNQWRPVHGFLYLLFAILNMMNIRNAWMILAVDVIVGLIAFSIHYYS